MIQCQVIGSGSKGNCVYVNIDNQFPLLLDIGLNFKTLNRMHREAGIQQPLSAIKGIFISHEHNDHIGGLKVFNKHYPGVMRLDTHCDVPVKFIKVEKGSYVSYFNLETFNAHHDEDVPCQGVVLYDRQGNSLVYLTDTGTVPCGALKYIMEASILIIEANHDPEMLLINEKYPDDLKARVYDTHLSNVQMRECVEECCPVHLEALILFHLSGTNNNPKLAEYEAQKAIEYCNKNGADIKPEIIVTEQKRPSKSVLVL